MHCYGNKIIPSTQIFSRIIRFSNFRTSRKFSKVEISTDTYRPPPPLPPRPNGVYIPHHTTRLKVKVPSYGTTCTKVIRQTIKNANSFVNSKNLILSNPTHNDKHRSKTMVKLLKQIPISFDFFPLFFSFSFSIFSVAKIIEKNNFLGYS